MFTTYNSEIIFEANKYKPIYDFFKNLTKYRQIRGKFSGPQPMTSLWYLCHISKSEAYWSVRRPFHYHIGEHISSISKQ